MKTQFVTLLLACAAVVVTSCTCPVKHGGGTSVIRATSGHLVAKMEGRLDEVIQEHPRDPSIKVRTKFLNSSSLEFTPGGIPNGYGRLSMTYRDVESAGRAFEFVILNEGVLESGPLTGVCEFFDANGASLVKFSVVPGNTPTITCKRPWISSHIKAIDRSIYDRARSVSLVIEGDFTPCRR